jgi:hypothetical protein
MCSLVKILSRWYWTVRGDRNSRVPISGFEAHRRPAGLSVTPEELGRPGMESAPIHGLSGGTQLTPPAQRRLPCRSHRASARRRAVASGRQSGAADAVAIPRTTGGRWRASLALPVRLEVPCARRSARRLPLARTAVCLRHPGPARRGRFTGTEPAALTGRADRREVDGIGPPRDAGSRTGDYTPAPTRRSCSSATTTPARSPGRLPSSPPSSGASELIYPP